MPRAGEGPLEVVATQKKGQCLSKAPQGGLVFLRAYWPLVVWVNFLSYENMCMSGFGLTW